MRADDKRMIAIWARFGDVDRIAPGSRMGGVGHGDGGAAGCWQGEWCGGREERAVWSVWKASGKGSNLVRGGPGWKAKGRERYITDLSGETRKRAFRFELRVITLANKLFKRKKEFTS